VLIVLGLLLLLSNLGVVQPGVWDTLWRLWPFALIALGVETLVGRRTRWGGLAVFGVFAVAALVGVWWSARSPGSAALTDHPLQVAVPQGTRRAELRLQSRIARLSVTAGPAGSLVSGQIQTLPNERLREDHGLRGDVAAVRLEASASGTVSSRAGTPRWTLALAPKLPWTLDVRTGVGTSVLDLRGVRVSELTLVGGVGATTVTLPTLGASRATLRGGVGELTVRLPEGIAARLVARAGVGAVQVTLPATRDGDTYIIGTPDTNPNRAEIRVEGGVGRVRVESAP